MGFRKEIRHIALSSGWKINWTAIIVRGLGEFPHSFAQLNLPRCLNVANPLTTLIERFIFYHAQAHV